MASSLSSQRFVAGTIRRPVANAFSCFFIFSTKDLEPNYPVSFFCREQPLQPSMSILGMLQQKFPFMAAMGDVINLTGNEMPMRSSHLIFLSRSFQC
jgi:hypothetical protein